ncbi:hypothetical protein BKA70DRAFT_1245895 [Coprinopsis sp. MPI-PUGE-AT-0042]|nr:hypothetical protein BKA70DRAFT_1245895 [Coprinopsis sp. MPI-PUGE-AT-0042]
MQEGDPKYVDGSIECDQCKNWYHYSCVQLDQDDLDILANDDTPYYCPACSIGTA